MYEYKVDIYKLKYAAEAMNAYAKEGWRVIAVSPDRQEGFVDVFFERVPVVEETVDKAAEELEAAVGMIDAVPDEAVINAVVTADAPVPEDASDNASEEEPGTTEATEQTESAPAAETAGNEALPTVEVISHKLTVCKLEHIESIDPSTDFFFIARTDTEVSLVCETERTPFAATTREDGWRALRFGGDLELSLTETLSKLSGLLSDNGISVFAVFTFDSDYVLIRETDLEKAVDVLKAAGYNISR